MPKPCARAFGLPFAGTPGPLNAISDVAGGTVGLTTLTDAEGGFDRGLPQKEMGSIIVGLITDAPLSGLSLRQVTQRAAALLTKTEVNGEAIDPLYMAAVQAVEEAVVNAMVAGEDVATFKPAGHIVPGIDTARLAALF